MKSNPFNRRRFTLTTAGLASTALLQTQQSVAVPQPASNYRPKYILGSCMYGYTQLDALLPEVKKTGATAIDIWPKVHGNQREQLQTLGEAQFQQMLKAHDVQLGCITQYKLGPFGLKDEMKLAQRMG
ncbi:MAG: sugar phosphate isomerase/epimerase, partial [Planctomycetota bacterium]|nr:sugar phosphate isomerase/epimerase [Planctomycetota bacterium]